MPEGGWIVLISVDNSAAQEVRCQENSTTLSPAIPGATYLLTIQAADSSGVLGGILEYTIPEAARFEGYAVNADLMEFSMCRTPSYDNWDRYALSDSDYTTEFHVGEAASFLIYLKSAYNRSSDDITTLFVIRNESGVVVDTITTTATWQQMWYRNYCELDIPRLPQTPGRYTISVFFNYSFATNVNFTIL